MQIKNLDMLTFRDPKTRTGKGKGKSLHLMKEETVLSTRGRETEGAERDEGWVLRKRKRYGGSRKG